jgi:thiamine biosynthesis lipoprotein
MTMSTPAERILVERSERIMATLMGVHLAVAPRDEERAQEAIARCMAWLGEVDRRFTRFTAESELSQLNASAGEWRTISPLLFSVLEQSLAAAQASDGLFDPGLLPLLEALGYDRDYKQIARREVAPEWRMRRDAAGPGAWRRIELDRAARRIRLPAGVRLDLGGIAKGWAADVALERFFGAFEDALVDAGGDIRARGGARPGEPWAIGISDPLAGARPESAQNGAHDGTPDGVVLTLSRGGLATSGATERWWFRAGERQHHLLDPRTGRPMRLWIDAGDDTGGKVMGSTGKPLIASATALAPTAAHAEVAAKVALLRGSDDYFQALAPVERAWSDREAQITSAACSTAAEGSAVPPFGDAGVALILVLGTGEVVCSANLQAYLQTLGGGGRIWLD